MEDLEETQWKNLNRSAGRHELRHYQQRTPTVIPGLDVTVYQYKSPETKSPIVIHISESVPPLKLPL